MCAWRIDCYKTVAHLKSCPNWEKAPGFGLELRFGLFAEVDAVQYLTALSRAAKCFLVVFLCLKTLFDIAISLRKQFRVYEDHQWIVNASRKVRRTF